MSQAETGQIDDRIHLFQTFTPALGSFAVPVDLAARDGKAARQNENLMIGRKRIGQGPANET